MFIFLWTVFVTAVVLLLMAIGATYRAHGGNDTSAPSLAEMFGGCWKPNVLSVDWWGGVVGVLMLRVGGVEDAGGRKGAKVVV